MSDGTRDIRATVYEGTRFGYETTEGSDVAATHVLYATSYNPSREGESRQFKRAGSKYNSASYSTKRWSGGSLEGDASYPDMAHLMRQLVGDPASVTLVAGETDVYDWVWDIRDDRPDRPHSISLERGSDAGAERLPGVTLTGLTINSTRDETTVSGDIMGQPLTPGIRLTGDAVHSVRVASATGGTFTLSVTVDGGSVQTTAGIAWNATAAVIAAAIEALSSVGAGDVIATGGPVQTNDVVLIFGGSVGARPVTLTANGASLTGTTPTVTPTVVQAGATLIEVDPIIINPQDVAYFLFDDIADIDDPQDEHYLDEGYSLELALSGKFGPRWTVDRRQKSYKGRVELAPDFTGTLVVGKQSADSFGDDSEIAADYLTSRLTDNEIAYIQLNALGEEIGVGSNYELAYTVAIRPEEASDEDTDGVSTLSFPLQAVVSAAWGRKVAQVRLRLPFGTL